MNTRILFMGTPEYAVPYLERLIQTGMKPLAVISQPDRPTGRKQVIEPTPVKKCAELHAIPIFQPEDIRTQEWVKKIQELAPDLIVVVAFGQIIPKAILDIPSKGCINVHPSLLPMYRGAAPLQEAIFHGEKSTGVSIMLMDEKMDHGPILAQEDIRLTDDETYDSLRKKTTAFGVPLLIDTINRWLEGNLQSEEQNDSQASYTRLLTRESGRIDWSRSAQEIDRHVRALNPWPGAWTEINGRRLKILKAHAISSDDMIITDVGLGELVPSPKPGTKSLETLIASCGNGYLEISELQPEGRKRMASKEFIHGNYLNIYRVGQRPLL